MKLRTTVFLWMILLVGAVLLATIGTATLVFDRSTRARLAADSARSRAVALDLHAAQASAYRQECRVLAEEPRLKAVVATEDIEPGTMFEQVQSLAAPIDAGVFVIVDAEGTLLADSADSRAAGSLADRDVVAQALAAGERSGVWLADAQVFLVHGCRLEFGARVVGALVIGHGLDDAYADQVARHTGGAFVLAVDGVPRTRLPPGVDAAAFAAAVAAIRAGATEVTLGGASWFAQLVSVPGYAGAARVDYVLLRSLDEALAPARRVLRALLVLVGLAVLGTLVLALGFARRLARPIDALVARTAAIAAGDLAPRPVTGPTEVRALGLAMDRMASELDDSRAQLADKERLARELEIAARIQTSILPRAPALDGLQLAARMVPATEVGGDYYDVLRAADGGWLAIGDASGHGLTAGLVMMMVQASVAALVAADPATTPKAVIRSVNHVLYENIHERLETERHMTLSLLRYRTGVAGGELVVAGAHMDGVVWRRAQRSCELLGTPGTFIAIADDIDRVNHEVTWTLAPGDVLVLLTDGVTEAEDARGTAFGYEGVVRLVEAQPEAAVEVLRDQLFAGLLAHSPVLADDATILVLRYLGGSAGT